MKKILAASALALAVAFPAFGQSPEKLQLCKDFESVAGSIMDARQSGVAYSDVYSVLKDSKLLAPLAELAYDTPKYNTLEYRLEAIANFKNMAFKTCIENIGE